MSKHAGKSSFGWAVLVAAVCALTAPAAHAQQYTVTGLGFLPGATTPEDFSYGVNNAGQVAGWSGTSTGGGHAFLWSPSGGMQDLTTLSGGLLASPNAINDTGQVVGEANSNHACLYSATAGMQDLGTLGGTSSDAYGINDAGTVVGYAENSSGNERAFLYSGTGPMQDLGTLGGTNSQGCGINDAGQVAGSAEVTAGAWHAFLYSATAGMEDLGTLPGGTSSDGYGINAAGEVVGNSTITGDSYPHAFLWSDSGGMEDLNNLIAAGSGWTLVYPSGINDSGQICGWGFYGVHPEAFLLTPTPEPASLVILALSGVSLLLRRRAGGR